LCGAILPPGFVIQGYLEAKKLRFSAEKSFYYEQSSIGFELQVAECNWLLRLGTHDPSVYDYRIVSSDGQNVYLLLSYETRLKNAAAQGRILPDNIGDGGVASGIVPRFPVAYEAGAIWLAFGCECFFARHTNSARLVVPFPTYIRPQPITQDQALILEQSDFIMNEGVPRIPTSIVYYLTNLTAEGYSLGQGFFSDQSFTNVEYKVTSFINVAEFRFPKEAIVSIYRPDDRKLPALVAQLCSEIRVVATNVIVGTSLQNFKPVLPGKTLISDQRFNNGTNVGFAYYQTNKWPDNEQARKSKAYEQAKIQRLQAASNVPIKANIVSRITILSVLIILPVAIWGASRYLKRT